MPAGDHAILLFEKAGKKRALAVAGDIAKAAGIPRIDLLGQLKKPHNYIMPYLDIQQARTISRLLIDKGIAAMAVPVESINIQYHSGYIRNADPLPDGLMIQNQASARETLMPWNVVRAVMVYHRKPAPRTPVELQVPGAGAAGTDVFSAAAPAAFVAGGLPALMALAGVELATHVFSAPAADLLLQSSDPQGPPAPADPVLGAGDEDDVMVLVMGNSPVLITSIEKRLFCYDYLGDRLRPAARDNFPLLVKDVCSYARPVYVNHALTRMLASGGPPGEEVAAGEVTRWLLEHVLALELLESDSVPREVLDAIGDDESVLVYLE
ncbi:MAG: hypothetical protein JW909_00995 [Planctomycetes bacterium]|nr:hypothetical protein [Planctomycetota bacterium]